VKVRKRKTRRKTKRKNKDKKGSGKEKDKEKVGTGVRKSAKIKQQPKRMSPRAPDSWRSNGAAVVGKPEKTLEELMGKVKDMEMDELVELQKRMNEIIDTKLKKHTDINKRTVGPKKGQ